MLIHWIWFAELSHISLRQKHQLLQHFSDPEEIYYSEDRVFAEFPEKVRDALDHKSLSSAEKILRDCADRGISIMTFGDSIYPSRLKNIFDPPLVLYYKGILPDWEQQPVIGVVGTRKATSYGMQAGMELGSQIAAGGGLLVSGGAEGVDTMALQGAVRAGKPAVAVLGGGVDVVYPSSNRQLFATLSQNGCLISEYPPKTKALGWHFPIRNRIISGLSNGVLVVEAPNPSGSLITAERAAEQGRDVFVVPGNIGVEACRGSNELLQQGAIPVLCGWDILKEYDALYPGRLQQKPAQSRTFEKTTLKVAEEPVYPRQMEKKKEPLQKKDIDNGEKSTYSVCQDLTPEEQAVAKLLTVRPQLMDEIIAQSGMPAGTVLSILTKLTLKGVIKNYPGRRVSLK